MIWKRWWEVNSKGHMVLDKQPGHSDVKMRGILCPNDLMYPEFDVQKGMRQTMELRQVLVVNGSKYV